MLIGITGGICSGKSRVAAYWSRTFQIPCIDLDSICREILCKGQPGWLALEKRYGNRFFKEDGQLDRKGFRATLFNDQTLRREVDSLLHPLAGSRMRTQYLPLKQQVVLVEVPLLFEAGWQDEVDRIVVVYATRQTRHARIIMRDQVSSGEAEQTLSIQWPLRQKIMAADHVVDNSGSWINTCLQIINLGRLYSPLP